MRNSIRNRRINGLSPDPNDLVSGSSGHVRPEAHGPLRPRCGLLVVDPALFWFVHLFSRHPFALNRVREDFTGRCLFTCSSISPRGVFALSLDLCSLCTQLLENPRILQIIAQPSVMAVVHHLHVFFECTVCEALRILKSPITPRTRSCSPRHSTST